MKKVLLALLVSLGLQTQAQINPCDSVEYAITSTVNTNLLQLEAWVNGTCPVNFPCIVSNYSWTVCDDNLCYGDTGTTVYFQQFMTTDTIKVCLDVIGDYNGITFTCQAFCDSLVFGPNGWMLLNMGNPTSINELQFTWEDDGIIYDMVGRKLIEVKVGQMYIRNNKKHIRIK